MVAVSCWDCVYIRIIWRNCSKNRTQCLDADIIRFPHMQRMNYNWCRKLNKQTNNNMPSSPERVGCTQTLLPPLWDREVVFDRPSTQKRSSRSSVARKYDSKITRCKTNEATNSNTHWRIRNYATTKRRRDEARPLSLPHKLRQHSTTYIKGIIFQRKRIVNLNIL